MHLLIKNCHVVNPGKKMTGTTDILIEEGSIKQIGSVSGFNGEIIDGNGMRAVSGFIDVHIQGAGGADILDNSEEALNILSRTQTQFGVTSFLATTIYRPDKDNRHLQILRDWMG